MSYFLSEENLQTGMTITVSGDEARHIALSRRAKVGDTIGLQGPDHQRFITRIHAIGKNSIKLAVEEKVATPPESSLHLILFQALIAEQALDIILQKSTELGVTDIVLFPSKHSPSDFTLAPKKLPRWKKIILEAAKQCDRAIPLQIGLTNSLQEAATQAQSLDHLWLLNPASSSKPTQNAIKSAGLFVGPEGGFSEEEIKLLSALPSCNTIGLGPRILRAETAAIAGVSLLQFLYGDLH